MSNIRTERMAEGVNIRLVPARQFKTNRITVFFNVPLKREYVTKISLLRQVMKRGSKNYPTLTSLATELEEMYGASLSGGIRKKGDGELFYFTVEYIADRFVGENLTKKATALLNEVVFNPFVENGGFSEEYLNQEKNNLKNYIEGIINDKREYAQLRCVSEMFDGEPYGIFEYGYVEDFDDVTPQNLYEFYKDIINEASVEIFVSGTFDEDDVINEIRNGFEIPQRNGKETETTIAKPRAEIKRITERMDITQSKLCIGLSCDVNYESEDYYALVLYNTVFGGSPFSKLFNNVREKLSLAYFVFSRVDKMKGFMLISSGIENDKYDEAYNEIMVQMSKMQAGDITEGEIVAAKKALANSFNSMRDSLAGMEDFYMSQIICKTNDTLDGIIDKINGVTKDEIVEVGKKIKLNTIYFLTGKEEK
ncbi:MAG: insulinase family protein [Ruminococcaceae bacterium]|nr:insulinase family protein [Oscillospiraceae bacterium]